MDLSDEVIGSPIKDQFTEQFEWQSSKSRMAHSKEQDAQGVPFTVACNGIDGEVLGRTCCSGCPKMVRGMCLPQVLEKNKQLGRSLYDEVSRYDRSGKKAFREAAINVLNGMPWAALKTYLQSHLAADGIADIKEQLNQWFTRPGYFALLVIDPDWFDSCEKGRDRISKTLLSPALIKKTLRCSSCNSRYSRHCSLFNRRFYQADEDIGFDDVAKIIDLHQAHGMISTELANSCKEAAKKDLFSGLARAVTAVVDKGQSIADANLVTNLDGLGSLTIEGNAILFENEPPEI